MTIAWMLYTGFTIFRNLYIVFKIGRDERRKILVEKKSMWSFWICFLFFKQTGIKCHFGLAEVLYNLLIY